MKELKDKLVYTVIMHNAIHDRDINTFQLRVGLSDSDWYSFRLALDELIEEGTIKESKLEGEVTTYSYNMAKL